MDSFSLVAFNIDICQIDLPVYTFLIIAWSLSFSELEKIFKNKIFYSTWINFVKILTFTSKSCAITDFKVKSFKNEQQQKILRKYDRVFEN
jgi:hypothetical protein